MSDTTEGGSLAGASDPGVLGGPAGFERWRRERLEFLVEVNDVVADCADRRDVMRAVAGAAVPRLGDWCVIYVYLDPADRTPALEVGHADPAVVAFAREFVDAFPNDPNAPWQVPHVIRTGQPEFHPDITEEVVATLPPAAAAAARELDLRSSIAVPLVKGRQVIGAMQFVLSGAGRRYTHDDLTLAQALAGRVASALDNRRLAEVHRGIAQTLQRSLLPRVLPDVPGADVSVRYWATGEATEMGGDFYDLFAIDDGTYAVVIGDVCGKGPAAAAVTALARHTIRASAWRGDDHLAVLDHLNTALLRSEPGTLCTVSYATVSPTPSGLRLVVASAGHPLPVLVRSDGSAAPIGEHGLLLGGFVDVIATAATCDIAPGEAVVLYTDGATDVRPPNTLGHDEMRALLASAVSGAPSADAAAARAFEALDTLRTFEDREDDVALVVVRAEPPSLGQD